MDPELDDPFKQLAASVILQAILDDLEMERKGWTVLDESESKPQVRFVTRLRLKKTPNGGLVSRAVLVEETIYANALDPETHTVPSTMRADVFRFYADCCGIECDYKSLKNLVRGQIDKLTKHQRSATAWLDVSIKSGSDG